MREEQERARGWDKLQQAAVCGGTKSLCKSNIRIIQIGGYPTHNKGGPAMNEGVCRVRLLGPGLSILPVVDRLGLGLDGG